MWRQRDATDLGESVSEAVPVTGADAVLKARLQPSSHHFQSLLLPLWLQSMSCDADAETVILQHPEPSAKPSASVPAFAAAAAADWLSNSISSPASILTIAEAQRYRC